MISAIYENSIELDIQFIKIIIGTLYTGTIDNGELLSLGRDIGLRYEGGLASFKEPVNTRVNMLK